MLEGNLLIMVSLTVIRQQTSIALCARHMASSVSRLKLWFSYVLKKTSFSPVFFLQKRISLTLCYLNVYSGNIAPMYKGSRGLILWLKICREVWGLVRRLSHFSGLSPTSVFPGRHRLNVKKETKLYFVALQDATLLLTLVLFLWSFTFVCDYRAITLCAPHNIGSLTQSLSYCKLFIKPS